MFILCGFVLCFVINILRAQIFITNPGNGTNDDDETQLGTIIMSLSHSVFAEKNLFAIFLSASVSGRQIQWTN